EGDWRILDPVTYENISVFPVVASYGQDTGAFLTLEEGLATGEVLIRERGSEEMVRGRDGRPVLIPQTTGASVNQLVLVNRSKRPLDRKSTRLNSSHGSISYAVFCLKKKKTNK